MRKLRQNRLSQIAIEHRNKDLSGNLTHRVREETKLQQNTENVRIQNTIKHSVLYNVLDNTINTSP